MYIITVQAYMLSTTQKQVGMIRQEKKDTFSVSILQSRPVYNMVEMYPIITVLVQQKQNIWKDVYKRQDMDLVFTAEWKK